MTGTLDPEILQRSAKLASALGNTELAAALESLRRRYEAAELLMVLLGETSSGKSSFVNALLGEDVIPTAPGATTSAAIEIRFNEDSAPRLEAEAVDGTRTAIDRARFVELSRTPGAARKLHIAWPIERLPTRVGDAASLRGLIVVDTPGYNACVREHADILTKTLPEADLVIPLLNFRRGVTPDDARFLNLVRNELGLGDVCMSFAVNWVSTSGGARQLTRMKEAVAKILGKAPSLDVMRHERVGNANRIWSDELWSRVRTMVESTARAEQRSANAARIALGWFDSLGNELDDRLRVGAAEEADLDQVREVIRRITAAREEARAAIDVAERAMLVLVDDARNRLREEAWRRIDAEIEQGGRFTEARTCGAFVAEHLVPSEFRSAAQWLEAALAGEADALADRIEKLQQDVGELTLPPIRLDGPRGELIRDTIAASGVRKATSAAFSEYLRSFGGATGAKGGFVNLSKSIVSKVGRVFGKTFSRQFYAGMGQALRRIGLSASVATGAVAAAVVEVAAYVYTVVRWKAKLRGVVQRALGRAPDAEPLEDALLRRIPFLRQDGKPPIEQFAEDSRSAIAEVMASTRAIVGTNFGRRVQVLESALEARAGYRTSSPEQLVEWSRELEALRCALRAAQNAASREEAA